MDIETIRQINRDALKQAGIVEKIDEESEPQSEEVQEEIVESEPEVEVRESQTEVVKPKGYLRSILTVLAYLGTVIFFYFFKPQIILKKIEPEMSELKIIDWKKVIIFSLIISMLVYTLSGCL